jgi:hypothetical protein
VTAAPPDRGPRAPPPTGGLLVLRVWFEPDHATPMRARIVGSVDPTGGTHGPAGPELPTLSATAASVEDAVRVVRRWLEGFEAPAGPASEGRGGDAAVTGAW